MALTTVNSSGIKDDSIVNADIKSDAAIALSKLASTPAVLTGSTNNTITTVTAANTIQGEANLTFDGSTLAASTDVKVQGGSGDTTLELHRTNAAGSNGNSFGNIKFTDNNDNEVAAINGIRSSAVDDADIIFKTRPTGGSATERFRIDSTGRLLVGCTAARTSLGATGTPSLQVEGLDASTAQISITRNANSAAGPYLSFVKTRGTSDGAVTIVQDGDDLGTIYFAAADGVDVNQQSGFIRCDVDGTPGSNDTPGRLEFATTPDGGVTPIERLRIDSSGNVTIRDAKQLLFENDAQNANSAILNLGASGASNLVFAAGGAERMRIDSSGKVGIGCTPSKMLDVEAAAGGDYIAHFRNGTSATPYSILIQEPNGAGAGYPLLNITNNGSSTEYFRVDSVNGVTKLKMHAGAGIDFSANSHASGMTSELLDGYEEGTWSPTLRSYEGSSWVDVSYDTNPSTTIATYTKIGRFVHFNLRMNGYQTNTQNPRYAGITGLPYVVVNNQGSGIVNYSYNTFNSVQNGVHVGYSQLDFYVGASWNTWGDGSNASMYLSGVYITSG